MYYEKLRPKLKEYFNILSNDFPTWLNDYIETSAMQRIGHISIDCGLFYTKLFKKHPWYSNLDHSVGVALIIWHFTKDKKATLAGLFHDIATPVFKHCIDFMNNDSEHQESTEEKTYDMIANSKEIMKLLKRDGIALDEVSDYKKYPVADNDMPRLSADRLEYNLSLAYFNYGYINKEELKEYYDNIKALKNEDNIDELGFTDMATCEKFMSKISENWPNWINDADRTAMQFIADICLSMKNLGYINVDDLYKLTERQIINKIKKCDNKMIREAFNNFLNTTKCYSSDHYEEGKYCINVKSKRRYLDPLINGKRAYDVSNLCKEIIDNYFKEKVEGFTYFDFDFQKII